MKPNFILTKDTLQTFINRFNKLLSYTGMVESQSFYNGVKPVNSVLKRFGITNRFLLHTEETNVQYYDKDTYSFDSYPSCQKIGTGKGIIIRCNDKSCSVIKWGQKIKFTPNQIILIGDSDIMPYQKYGRKVIYRIGHDIKKGKDINNLNNKYSEMYWKDVEADMFDDIFF